MNKTHQFQSQRWRCERLEVSDWAIEVKKEEAWLKHIAYGEKLAEFYTILSDKRVVYQQGWSDFHRLTTKGALPR